MQAMLELPIQHLESEKERNSLIRRFKKKFDGQQQVVEGAIRERGSRMEVYRDVPIEKMCRLLNRLIPENFAAAKETSIKWNSKSQFRVKKEFERRFDYVDDNSLATILRGGNVIPKGMIDAVKLKPKRETGVGTYKHKCENEIEAVTRVVFKVLSNKIRNDAVHNVPGSPTYAHGTQASATKLCLAFDEIVRNIPNLRKAICDKTNIFIDLGVGTGAFLTSLVRLYGCHGLGIEVCTIRCRVLLEYLVDALKSSSFNDKLAVLPMDLFDLTSLVMPDKYTFMTVFIGDEAFPDDLMFRIRDMLRHASIPILLITNKEGRHRSYKHFWCGSVFEPVKLGGEPVRTRYAKTSSSEKGTFRFYIKHSRSVNSLKVDPYVNESLRSLESEISQSKRHQWLLNVIGTNQYPLQLVICQTKRKRQKRKYFAHEQYLRHDLDKKNVTELQELLRCDDNQCGPIDRLGKKALIERIISGPIAVKNKMPFKRNMQLTDVCHMDYDDFKELCHQKDLEKGTPKIVRQTLLLAKLIEELTESEINWEFGIRNLTNITNSSTCERRKELLLNILVKEMAEWNNSNCSGQINAGH